MVEKEEFLMESLLQSDKMLKNIKIFILTILFFGVLQNLFAQPQIIPVKDLKIGMKGVGRTVIQGRKIETFEVEVLGILSNNKINENLLINGESILVKVSGDVIRRAGGIAAGMSGSPVYIDGKIMGGLSSGWVMTDHTVGLVTPIEEMLEIWNYPEYASINNSQKTVNKWILQEPIKIGAKTVKSISEFPTMFAAKTSPNQKNELKFVQASPALYMSGLRGRAADLLKKRLGRNNIQLVNNTMSSMAFLPEEIKKTTEVDTASETFEPGSAIGVQLARGDINLSTLGTLTYKDGNKILALAHPFLKRGNVQFLMTGAHIYHSFSSVKMPFKIGAPAEMVGIITQDREKGLSGEIGRLPKMVPVQVSVRDKDLKINKNINYQIVSDPAVFSMVLDSTLLQALESTIDREGPGTAQVGISMDCVNKDGEEYSFRRENTLYSKSDISQNLVTEISALVEKVTESDIEEVLPTRLLIKAEIEKKRRTVAIEKVEVKNSSVTSGGVLDVEVTMRPYRDKPFIRKVKIPIPQEIGKGDGKTSITLSAFGLNSSSNDNDMSINSHESKFLNELNSDEAAPIDFDSVIRNISEKPKNSDILFQLSVDGDDMKKIKINGMDYLIQPTNLVVTGRVDTTLTLSEE